MVIRVLANINDNVQHPTAQLLIIIFLNSSLFSNKQNCMQELTVEHWGKYTEVELETVCLLGGCITRQLIYL